MNESLHALIGGPIAIYQIDERTTRRRLVQTKPHNLVLYNAGDILAKLLAGTGAPINTLYFEFTNASPPTVTPTLAGGHSYYAGLSGSLDFLRVPIVNTPTTVNATSGNYVGNVVHFAGQTAGSQGYLYTASSGASGLQFSSTAGSQIIGAALVSSPTVNFADDLVFARFYFASALAKVANQQVGIDWPVSCKAPTDP